MNGKKHSTEEKIRILRQTRIGKSILDVCRERSNSEPTFHKRKRELGMLDLNQAKRLKELEKENKRFKLLLADNVLNIEILQEFSEKIVSPGHKRYLAQDFVSREDCSTQVAFRFHG